jgi:hypothetical protein
LDEVPFEDPAPGADPAAGPSAWSDVDGAEELQDGLDDVAADQDPLGEGRHRPAAKGH